MITSKEKRFLSAVLYIHNNEKEIPSFLSMLYKVFDDSFEKFEIICVNDYSTDNSVTEIQKFAQGSRNSVFSIIDMSMYHGVELSMNAGVDISIGDVVFEFDSLEQNYLPQTIMDVYTQSLKGFDIVAAAPRRRQSISSMMFYSLFNKHSMSSYMLRTESFRILSRRAINRVHAMNKTIPYRKAVYSSCGLKIDTLIYNAVGDSGKKIDKMDAHMRKKVAVDTLLLFTDVVYKMSLFISAVMAAFAVVTGCYTVIVYFAAKKPVEGWTPIMAFLAVGFFGVFVILAFIIKYIDVLVGLVFKKQTYLVSGINKLN